MCLWELVRGPFQAPVCRGNGLGFGIEGPSTRSFDVRPLSGGIACSEKGRRLLGWRHRAQLRRHVSLQQKLKDLRVENIGKDSQAHGGGHAGSSSPEPLSGSSALNLIPDVRSDVSIEPISWSFEQPPGEHVLFPPDMYRLVESYQMGTQ